ncbi:Transposable element Tcb1 transposase [Oopsacas minuta]|uniref:Transposable element Tcb1 transposase n=1 Tax=Oopsacas minuta TaxID=111878 RepID=A0AAV7JVQ1_9METZ|nr:Transposable element Tcb1 transposase [Oopsacas minuta]
MSLPRKKSNILVWDVMSYQALSDLHIIAQGQTVTSDYYVEVSLKQSLTSSLLRTRDSGTILERKLLPDRSQAISTRWSPPLTSKSSQEWLKNIMAGFWTKEIWPPNSPDLNPIENLWALLQTKLDANGVRNQPISFRKIIKLGLEVISPETLERLIAGIPGRSRKCLKLHRDYIGKLYHIYLD